MLPLHDACAAEDVSSGFIAFAVSLSVFVIADIATAAVAIHNRDKNRERGASDEQQAILVTKM